MDDIEFNVSESFSTEKDLFITKEKLSETDDLNFVNKVKRRLIKGVLNGELPQSE